MSFAAKPALVLSLPELRQLQTAGVLRASAIAYGYLAAEIAAAK
ncbi:hypothetical protein [Treponema phagedenis]|nr:hypothetical protein [Treponema phagedenis]EFW38393.1 hypothetical protein HMPREF9554_01109 [Treponema phagedenis F0421]